MRTTGSAQSASEPPRGQRLRAPRGTPQVDLIPARDALGVDGEQDFNAVTSPFSNLRGWHPGVEPQRYAAVTQVVGTAGED